MQNFQFQGYFPGAPLNVAAVLLIELEFQKKKNALVAVFVVLEKMFVV